jgi:hypothetical protein
LATQTFVAFCVRGTVGTHNIITSKKEWPKRESLIAEQKNVVNTPLINPEKVYLRPSHIKLGFIKSFVKKLSTVSF